MSIIPSFQLICTAAQLIWTHHWIGLEKLPNLTFHLLNSWCVSQFVSNLPSFLQICTAAQLIWTHYCNGPKRLPQFDLSYVKFPGVYLNLCQFYHHVSWFVQLHSWFELTTGFALKNFSNLTFNMWDSLVCISILPLCQLICTADQLSWHHHWIGLEKLPQFDL